MLMFVFGAGASYDSNPARLPGRAGPSSAEQYRPPLATGLFSPSSDVAEAAIAAFPRAAPLIMRLREATSRGLDVEQVLEQLQAEEERYSATGSQLLALRSYLAQLMTECPAKWGELCQGLTNYVLALDEAARWNAATSGDVEPVGCVTFNYDTLLEDAVQRVFGWRIHTMETYAQHSAIHVFKPHGSVNWRQEARWHPGSHFIGRGALDAAIDRAAQLEWLPNFTVRADDKYQDDRDQNLAMLPALAIPVQRKANFMMPDEHREALVKDLERTSMLVAVGWRAREQHFLKMIQDHLPSQPGRLVAVAESEASARETVENLWSTGRFDRYAVSTLGFSGFAQTPPARQGGPRDDGVHLRDVLTTGWGTWVDRVPGRGLMHAPDLEPSNLATYVNPSK